MADENDLIEQQMAYYRARAGEYDEWFLRQGRYDRGPELNQLWFDEVAAVRTALERFAPRGQVLELACGTGLWTEQLLRFAGMITAVDAAAEVIALNQQRLNSPRVRYVKADLFRWQPEERYDVVFFSFWLSHVPAERFAAFWELVARALKPGGRAFFIDSSYEPTSTARDHALGPASAERVVRRLKDGSEYEIVKIFYRPAELSARLQALGWKADVRETAHYFLYGQAAYRF
jgi:demethylmenaquinone methyltransferase/2-methoxy-6-polyprenyl-1,4-benzoquinol methylase